MKCTEFPWLDKLLGTTRYATIATIRSDGLPWNTPLAVVFDKDMTMYWVSAANSQHSLNLVNQPVIFAVLFDSTAPEGEGKGVYMQMHAQELKTPGDIVRAKEIYPTDFFRHKNQAHVQFGQFCPQRIYRARLLRAWRNSETQIYGHYTDCRKLLKFRK